MMTLLTGGSKCGKSAFAERILAAFSGQKYYIAAMQPYGSDAAEKRQTLPAKAGRMFKQFLLAWCQEHCNPGGIGVQSDQD